jgi:hypothetical protein
MTKLHRESIGYLRQESAIIQAVSITKTVREKPERKARVWRVRYVEVEMIKQKNKQYLLPQVLCGYTLAKDVIFRTAKSTGFKIEIGK